MFLKDKHNGHMIEVLSLNDLFNLYHDEIVGRCQVGEELQDPEKYLKKDLVFLSGEELPRCWVDPDYRHQQYPNGQYRELHS
ncbi:acetyltransferase [Litoribacillus peritrichatus]|uniref:Acetyltransferase n=1 Tax=Litoribacillus peritrichatus TaxID=718191 RepID=A0ABP7MS64_9GAMM